MRLKPLKKRLIQSPVFVIMIYENAYLHFSIEKRKETDKIGV